MASITTFNGRRCTKIRRTSTITTSAQVTATSIVSTTIQPSGTPGPQAASAPPSSSSSSSSSTSSTSSSSSSSSLSSQSPSSSSSLPSSSASPPQISRSRTRLEETSTRTSTTLTTSTAAPVPLALPSEQPSPPPPPPPLPAPPPPPPPPTSAVDSSVIIASSPPPTTTPIQLPPESATVQSVALPSELPTSAPLPSVAPAGPSAPSSVAPAALSSVAPVVASSITPAPVSSIPVAQSEVSAEPEVTAEPEVASSSTEVSPTIPTSSAASPNVVVPVPQSTDVPLPASSLPTLASTSLPLPLAISAASSTASSPLPGSTVLPISVGASATPSEPIGNNGLAPSGTISAAHDPSADSQSGSHSGKTAAIAAGTISGIIALLLIAGIIFCFRRRNARNRIVESHSPSPLEKRRGPRTGIFKWSGFKTTIKSWISKPAEATSSVTAAIKGKFHRRGESSAGLMGERPPMTMAGAQAVFRSRRSRSEPRPSFTVSRPSAERHNKSQPIIIPEIGTVERPRSLESPHPMNQYSLPWTTNNGNATPTQTTLRVVNSDDMANGTPTPRLGPANTDFLGSDGYFGPMFPPKAAAPAAAAHRRSISLQPQPPQNPFADPPDNVNLVSSWLNEDPTKGHARNRSQAHHSNPASSYYGTQRNTQFTEYEDRGLHRASQALADAILTSKIDKYRGSLPANPFDDPAPISTIPAATAEFNTENSNRSSISSTKSSVLRSFQLYDGSTDASAGISPVTIPSTISRNASDASYSTVTGKGGFGGGQRLSYDPFNFAPTAAGTSQSNAQLLTRNASNASSRSGRSARTASTVSGSAFFLDSESLLDFDESCPTRPPTDYASFEILNGPPPKRMESRRRKGVSNDPFDLDRPEVLGYTPSVLKKTFNTGGMLGRSDSSASQGSVRKNRRRSSVQEDGVGWRYMDEIEEGSARGVAM